MWLRLRDSNDQTVMVNSDHVVWFLDKSNGDLTELHVTYYGGDRNVVILVKESTEEIAAMLIAA
jgi:hypothetical protein